ncbi:hypothetical protein P9D43_29180 [Neobacillus niacini]|uniref:hypothetical protein n=1 Tax=Neobacillus niacini TaxID=86668 RepID=UPI0007AC0F4D|nr:hypothetical protein [Neobacillus niacini]MEC1526069.1 hypothetical protein [Neobacillus niacini]
MDIQTQVLDSVLRKYGKPDKELLSSLENVNEEVFMDELNKLNLSEYTHRDTFFWELQTSVEKCVAEHGASDDNERLAEMIVGGWNQSKEPKINQSVVLSFLYTVQLKFLNSRKAFMSVCDGDLQSYKTFNSKPRLFLDLLIRYFTCISGKQQINNILRVLEGIMPLLMEGSSRSDYRDALNRLGFQNRKGQLVYGKMNAYKRVIGVENLVYGEGIRTILLEALSNVEDELLAPLKEKLQSLGQQELQNEIDETEEDFQVEDLLDEHVPEINAPSSLEPKQDNEHPTQTENEVISSEEEVPSAENEQNIEDSEVPIEVGGIGLSVQEEKSVEKAETDAEPKNGIVSSLENALSAVQSALALASQLPAVEKEIEISEKSASPGQLKIAEEEINRLKSALQQEKEKVEQVEEKAYQKVLQAIGGESSNYLLSDLFEESQGKAPSNPNISAGRLINLFSSLSLAIGLEEHSNGYELGDTFSVGKDELIKNYRIDGPVTSQGDEIKIKLLKYGWTINGRVVIQPLVTEIKEEV